MKKKFILAYSPAQLRENKEWYIEYKQLNPATNLVERFRKTFYLNTIKDLKLRRRRGKELCNYINSVLPFGYPFIQVAEVEELKNELEATNIIAAIDVAYKIKMKSDRINTTKTMRSHYNIFTSWLRDNKYDQFRIIDFQPRHAKQYMDYALVDRDVNNNTYNNYLTNVNLFFNELIRGEYLHKNPFRKIRKRKKSEPMRRRFTDDERKVVADHLFHNDIWMFYAVLLQYYCYIRPVELIRLKKSNFLLDKQLIHLPPNVTKMKTTRYTTIPDSIMPFFQHSRFRGISRHHYIFAPGLCPGPKPYSRYDKMYKKHCKVLAHLLKVGKLDNIEKLVWYSWKYTGIKNARKEMALDKISEQAGHASLDQTRDYFLNDNDEVNAAVKVRSFDLLDI